jgi:hypothetical protein
MWAELSAKLLNGTASAGEGLDLSLIGQLLGHKDAGLAIQREVLASHRLFRLPCASKTPRLRVLALAAATDMGSNTPIEFLLENSDIELMVLYVIGTADLPAPLPDHDIAIVIASDSDDCRDALQKIGAAALRWPRPLLNPPQRVGNLDRDKLFRLLDGIEGLAIPATIGAARGQLAEAARSAAALAEMASGLAFPIIVRPRGSHAGVGLARIDDAPAMRRYLAESEAKDFFVSRFIDYSSADGLFRKYRIVFIDGKPYACHMAIADRWDIWYLNAGMSGDAPRRGDLHVHLRHRLRPPASDRARGDGGAPGPRLFPRRLRADQGWRAADFRSGQYRRRSQHGPARHLSLQAAADAEDLRRVRGDAGAPCR